MARYPPIAEHGLIGDLHTVALVGDERTCFDRSTSLLAVVESALLRAAGASQPLPRPSLTA